MRKVEKVIKNQGLPLIKMCEDDIIYECVGVKHGYGIWIVPQGSVIDIQIDEREFITIEN